MRTITSSLKMTAAALGIAVLAACGGGGGGGTAGSGTLSVALTDASCGGEFSAVNITVNKVRVHQSDNAGEGAAGWSDIDINPPRKVNLLTLMNGVLEELGQTRLPAGHYTQVRLVLERNTKAKPFNNSVVPTSGPNTGTEVSLDTPSGVQSGIKLIHQFTVEPDEFEDLVLDFDACRSIVIRGNGTYGLKPVIRAMPGTLTGIGGIVDLTLTGVVVSAQKGGLVIRQTVPNSAGAFVLEPIDPGQSPYDVVITAPDYATAVVANVPVETDKVTQISTSVTPITLPASAMHTVSGTVMPAAASATVRALQAVEVNTIPLTIPLTVPVAEIAYVNADDMTGEYLLRLPAGAPMLAAYSTTLPLTFAADTAGNAGQYTIEASATGYVTQKTMPPIDLSSADLMNLDFTLVP